MCPLRARTSSMPKVTTAPDTEAPRFTIEDFLARSSVGAEDPRGLPPMARGTREQANERHRTHQDNQRDNDCSPGPRLPRHPQTPPGMSMILRRMPMLTAGVNDPVTVARKPRNSLWPRKPKPSMYAGKKNS